MRQPGFFEQVVETEGRIASACYDGRYVWAPFSGRDAGLAVLGPKSGQVWRFTREDGMIPISHYAAIIPVQQGKVCLAAEFQESSGTRHRTWVAVLTMSDQHSLSVDVLDTARVAPDALANVDAPETTDPNVASDPVGLCPLSDPSQGPPRAFLMFRRGRPTLRIDLEKRTVDLPADLFGGAEAPRDATWHRGYLLWRSPPNRLWRAAPPAFEPELLMKPIPWGNTLIDGDWLHLIQREEWHCVNLVTGESFVACDKLPTRAGAVVGKFRLVRSGHYGWVLLGAYISPRPVQIQYRGGETP